MSAINWKGVAFYTVLVIVAALVVLYFAYAPFKTLLANVAGQFSFKLPNIDFNGIFQWIQANPLATTVFGFLGTTAVGYVIKNWQTNKLLNQATDEILQTKVELSNAKTDAAKYAESLKMYSEDTTAMELQKTINGLKSEYGSALNAKEAAYKEAQLTITRLQEQLDARPVIKYEVPT